MTLEKVLTKLVLPVMAFTAISCASGQKIIKESPEVMRDNSYINQQLPEITSAQYDKGISAIKALYDCDSVLCLSVRPKITGIGMVKGEERNKLITEYFTNLANKSSVKTANGAINYNTFALRTEAANLAIGINKISALKWDTFTTLAWIGYFGNQGGSSVANDGGTTIGGNTIGGGSGNRIVGPGL